MNINSKKRTDTTYILASILLVVVTFIIVNIKHNEKGIVINGKFLLTETKGISVYLSGEVKKEGVIILRKNDTLKDAIDKCGGITSNANIQKIEFDRKLKNGDKILIATRENSSSKITDLLEENNKMNINIASYEQLQKLDGIGPSIAQKIIDYREVEEFCFIEDIMKVKGIGKGKFNNIKEKISVN